MGEKKNYTFEFYESIFLLPQGLPWVATVFVYLY